VVTYLRQPLNGHGSPESFFSGAFSVEFAFAACGSGCG
jgi:hypothetical protein